MSLTKDVLGVGIGIGSLALVSRSAKMINESMKPKGKPKLIKGMVDLTVGTALLGASAKLVGELD